MTDPGVLVLAGTPIGHAEDASPALLTALTEAADPPLVVARQDRQQPEGGAQVDRLAVEPWVGNDGVTEADLPALVKIGRAHV